MLCLVCVYDDEYFWQVKQNQYSIGYGIVFVICEASLNTY